MRGTEVLEGNHWCPRALKKMSEEGGGGEGLATCTELRSISLNTLLMVPRPYLNSASRARSSSLCAQTVFPPHSLSEFLYAQQDGVVLYFHFLPTLIVAAKQNKRAAFLQLFIKTSLCSLKVSPYPCLLFPSFSF